MNNEEIFYNKGNYGLEERARRGGREGSGDGDGTHPQIPRYLCIDLPVSRDNSPLNLTSILHT